MSDDPKPSEPRQPGFHQQYAADSKATGRALMIQRMVEHVGSERYRHLSELLKDLRINEDNGGMFEVRISTSMAGGHDLWLVAVGRKKVLELLEPSGDGIAMLFSRMRDTGQRGPVKGTIAFTCVRFTPATAHLLGPDDQAPAALLCDTNPRVRRARFSADNWLRAYREKLASAAVEHGLTNPESPTDPPRGRP